MAVVHRALLAVALCSMVSCANEGAADTTTAVAPAACAPAPPALQVGMIAAAMAAVEHELGGPQQYYEINATELLVNVFVDGGDGRATPFVYVDGTLTSGDPLDGASGHSFTADRVDFDAQRVTSCVTSELPDSVPTAFEVVGGRDGAVRYSVLVTSKVGGQLVVEVGPDGIVIAVDPV